MGVVDYFKNSFAKRIPSRSLIAVHIILFSLVLLDSVKPAYATPSQPPCGGDGWPCCITGTTQDCESPAQTVNDCTCNTGLTCVDEIQGGLEVLTCLGNPACGGENEPCCISGTGPYCEEFTLPGLSCENTPQGDRCVSCGNQGDYCCGGGRAPCVGGQSLYCAPNGAPAGSEHNACMYVPGGCGGTGDACCTVGLPCTTYGDECQGGTCVYVGLDNVNTPRYGGPIISSLPALLAPIFKILFYAGLFIGILGIIYSGYLLIASEGDPGRVKEGKEQFTAAVLGSLFVLLSVIILRVILNNILGVNSGL